MADMEGIGLDRIRARPFPGLTRAQPGPEMNTNMLGTEEMVAKRGLRLLRMLEDYPQPLIQLSPEDRVLEYNPASVPLLEAWRWTAFTEAPEMVKRLAKAARARGEQVEMEVAVGTRRYTLVAVASSDGVVGLYGREITTRGLESEPRLEVAGGDVSKPSGGPERGDALTGLPNREVLVNALGRLLERAVERGGRVALIKVNIDNCRDINAAYGHRFGDEIIRLIGHCIRDHVGERDLVCRDAGDEFLVVLSGFAERSAITTLCDALLAAVPYRASGAGLEMQVSLSMGFAVYPEDADSAETLMEHANHALSEAKNAGRGCWRDYLSAARANPLISGSHLCRRLLEALRHRRLRPFYQPIVDAYDGRVAGFEALVRWQDAELGWVSPQEFIPVAEARGLAVEMGRQVAGAAMEQLGRWRAAGHKIGVSLNVSKRSLMEPAFVAEMRALLYVRGLRAEWVTLEATEQQALLHDATCREALERAAASGFRMALDDFGSGHSSFDMVADLPFHELKIDMSLARKAKSGRGRRIVQSILEMCRTLGVESVVEGIEDERLAKVLRAIGASRLQGYYYARPMPAEAVMDYLATKGTVASADAKATR